MIGEPVTLQVVLAEKGLAPVLHTGQSSASLEEQVRTGNADSPANLLPELADDPLVRVAVQELGAVARAL